LSPRSRLPPLKHQGRRAAGPSRQICRSAKDLHVSIGLSGINHSSGRLARVRFSSDARGVAPDRPRRGPPSDVSASLPPDVGGGAASRDSIPRPRVRHRSRQRVIAFALRWRLPRLSRFPTKHPPPPPPHPPNPNTLPPLPTPPPSHPRPPHPQPHEAYAASRARIQPRHASCVMGRQRFSTWHTVGLSTGGSGIPCDRLMPDRRLPVCQSQPFCANRPVEPPKTSTALCCIPLRLAPRWPHGFCGGVSGLRRSTPRARSRLSQLEAAVDVLASPWDSLHLIEADIAASAWFCPIAAPDCGGPTTINLSCRNERLRIPPSRHSEAGFSPPPRGSHWWASNSPSAKILRGLSLRRTRSYRSAQLGPR